MTRAASMPRALLVASIALLCAVSAAGTAQATRKAPRSIHAVPSAAPYDAQLLSCRRSLRIDARVVALGASMRPLGDGRRLALRIDLYQRPLVGGRWTLRSDVPGLGVWTPPSDPTIGSRPNDVFKYRQAVGRLVVPFQYRFRVGFRWSDVHGRILREAVRWTGACREPDLRPDLTVARVRQIPDAADPTMTRYVVLVRNRGLGVARAVRVAALFGGGEGEPMPTRTVARLAPRQVAEVSFSGPSCAPGAPPPTFTVDPANAIDESRETNNSLEASCPAP